VTSGLQPLDGSGTKLFKLSPDTRWRSLLTPGPMLTLKNVQGVIIFRLRFKRRGSLGAACKWWVQVPGGKGHRSVAFSDSSKSKSWSTGIDLNIENLVMDGKPVIIHTHQPRSEFDLYHATVDGVVVARATRFKAEPKSKFSSWQVEVAKGFDLALVGCNCGQLDATRTYADLLIGCCHMQNTGLAPVDQRLGQRRGQTIARLP
jgi:hypothetical protein